MVRHPRIPISQFSPSRYECSPKSALQHAPTITLHLKLTVMSNEKINWKGASGKLYDFEIFSIDANFDPNQNGNYIFAKRTSKGWYAVYIGEGDIQTRTRDETHRSCALKKGATHIHAHLNNNETDRKTEESDLLGYNSEAYQPVGCNVKIGG